MKEQDAQEGLALDQLREEVTEGLVRRFSREALSLEEFERRTALVTKAETRSDILGVIADLPEEAPSQLPSTSRNASPSSPRPRAGRATAASSGAEAGWRIASGAVREVEHSVCIFGGTDRRGVWTAPRSFQSLCVFGGANLDLRKAIIPPEGITIKVLAIFGGVDVIVPPDLRLDVRGIGIFGGFDHRETPDAPEDAPVVRIEGIACFGGVGVRVRT